MAEFLNFIGGAWAPGAGVDIPNRNPSDLDDLVGTAVSSTPDDVDAAVDAARLATGPWAATSIQERADILESIASRILSQANALGRQLAREEGKTEREAIAEAVRAGQIFRFFSGEALRMGGERIASTRPGVVVDIMREPVGVVGVLTPWNFPLAIPAWKVAPALAFGNTVVLKPAELVPASACSLASIAQEAGLPPGVLNVVLGRGSVLGDAITTHPAVDAVTFTGSQEVGRRVLAQASGRFAKVQLEMGGKNPLVIAADADIDLAVECALQGAFFSTGQRCTASSRLIVEDPMYDRVVSALSDRMRSLRVGHALERATDIGPVVSDEQLSTNLQYLANARSDGGNVVGGEVMELATRGYFQRPALVLGTSNDDQINREEVFGPVASVLRATDLDDAISMANATPFGLVAGICTTSLRSAERFKAVARAGLVMVNLPTAGLDVHVPFGGRKASSYGPREQGTYAKDFYTDTKTAYVRP